MGIWFPTRMTVAVLQDGSLWIESPVSVTYETLTRLTGLGPVGYLVANTPRHVWRLESWHDLFPDAQLWAPRASPVTLAHRKVPLTGRLGPRSAKEWAEDFHQVAIEGSPFLEEVWFLHKPSRTLIVGDLIQVHDLSPGSVIGNALKRVGHVAGPDGGTAVDIRATFWDRKALRASLEQVLGLDFHTVVLAHGPCIENDAKAFVERAVAWALP
jgi:hypothetical protein